MFSVSKKEGELVGPRTCVSLFMEFWNVGIAQRRFWVVIAAKESQFGQGCPVMRQLFIYSYSFWLFIKAPWSQFQAPTFFPMKTSPAWIIGTLIRNRQCHCLSDIPEGKLLFSFCYWHKKWEWDLQPYRSMKRMEFLPGIQWEPRVSTLWLSRMIL